MPFVQYVKPEYSNSAVDRSAASLLEARPGSFEYVTALRIINQWRSSHLYPLGKVRQTLKNRSRRVDKKALVVQRLKRLSSIENKLVRLTGSRLTGMQDIGGCRSILRKITDVQAVARLYRQARDSKRLDRSALIFEKDYIDRPKETGYRGIHLVMRYQSLGLDTEAWNGKKVEVQLRTQLQHNWATAVESMSTFLSQSLKSHLGDERWLRFFALASGIIAEDERTTPVPDVPVGPGLLRQARDLWRDLNVDANIRACAVLAYPHFASQPAGSYYVLSMDAEKRTTNVESFSENALLFATARYNQLESENARRPWMNVVLVRVDDVRELKTAYPNYWVDATDFSEYIGIRLFRDL